MYRTIDQMVEDQLNDYLNEEEFMDTWDSSMDSFILVDEEEFELTDEDLKILAMDNLRNRLCNEYVDLLAMEDAGIKFTERQQKKYDRLLMYFLKIPMKKMEEWINSPVNSYFQMKGEK